MKVGLICNLANGEVGGQTAKTNRIIDYLGKKFDLEIYDVFPAKKNLLKIMVDSIGVYRKTDKLVIILNTNGSMVVLTGLRIARLFAKKPIYEVAVGGTRQKKVETSRYFKGLEKMMTKIFVETSYMASEFHRMGLPQTEVLDNCKEMKPEGFVTPLPFNGTLRMCTFARVTEDKGIDTAMEIAKALDAKGRKVALDILGPVDPSYEEEFRALLGSCPKDVVEFKGVVDSQKTVETLNNYHILLFPTRHKEGFPGAFIDAMEAGLTIISSYLDNFVDIIRNDENGYLLKDATKDEYVKLIEGLIENPSELERLRMTALKYSRKYSNEVALANLEKYLRE